MNTCKTCSIQSASLVFGITLLVTQLLQCLVQLDHRETQNACEVQQMQIQLKDMQDEAESSNQKEMTLLQLTGLRAESASAASCERTVCLSDPIGRGIQK